MRVCATGRGNGRRDNVEGVQLARSQEARQHLGAVDVDVIRHQRAGAEAAYCALLAVANPRLPSHRKLQRQPFSCAKRRRARVQRGAKHHRRRIRAQRGHQVHARSMHCATAAGVAVVFCCVQHDAQRMQRQRQVRAAAHLHVLRGAGGLLIGVHEGHGKALARKAAGAAQPHVDADGQVVYISAGVALLQRPYDARVLRRSAPQRQRLGQPYRRAAVRAGAGRLQHSAAGEHDASCVDVCMLLDKVTHVWARHIGAMGC